MAHYAFLDENNIVVEVIVGKNENEDGINWEEWYGNFRGLKCLRTSYNTIGNKHLLGGKPFRGNFAGIGYTYNEELDVFLAKKPFDSWVLNIETLTYEPPIPYPTESGYIWNEEKIMWVKDN